MVETSFIVNLRQKKRVEKFSAYVHLLPYSSTSRCVFCYCGLLFLLKKAMCDLLSEMYEMQAASDFKDTRAQSRNIIYF